MRALLGSWDKEKDSNFPQNFGVAKSESVGRLVGVDAKHKHLELIQGVISRMAHNSFLLKSWSVVLVSALFALSAKEKNGYLVPLAYFPAIAFWVLDGYFLWQERLFRKVYDHVRTKENSAIDFSMNVAPFLSDVEPWWKVTFSLTLRIFHGTIVGTIILVMLVFYKYIC